MVRDLARQVNKPMKLEVLGSNTPIDRDILERLEASLTHLLNNAVDHGIELQGDRTGSGASRIGLTGIASF